MEVRKQFNARNLAAIFLKCLQDERGIAMSEYLIVTAIMVMLSIFLFNPDNGLYQALRNQYNVTTTLLGYPGP